MNIQPLLNYYKNHLELNQNQIDLIKSLVKERTYLKGQYILQQGDVSKCSNFIVKGCVKMSFVDREANDHIVMFGVEDWWVSDLASYISGKPADYNIQCIETTTVLQFHKDSEIEINNAIPELEAFYNQKLTNALITAQNRIIQNFSHTAKERYQLFREKYPNHEKRIPQYMIASYLGITKEFFSKMKKEVTLEK